MAVRRLLTILLQFAISIMQVLLGLRIVFKMVTASEGVFVQWVYSLSDPLVFPFSRYFPDTMLSAMFYLDLAAIIAIILYTMVGYFLLSMVAKPKEWRKRKYYS
ncbi:YGGT family protein [Salinibacillus kushneri]|uniref:YGGT family protein n=1 Tax=Salinibacillus kushneri TaxID=237682 RepID=A0A1I0ARY7_9BACI|nr:YggT family protein [Salinibacillus kushneri]SES97153.1 YGGT family protein [Salinibacillus kushneri]